MDESESVSTLRSYLELLRLPNVFTAVADVAMGFFFVVAGGLPGGDWALSDDQPQTLLPIAVWTLALLAAASALFYSAGMVLNDVFDIELDREEQPDRPLPSGRIRLAAARWLGWQLLTLGIMFASGAAVLLDRRLPARMDFVLTWRPALVAALLAALIVLYNAGLKRTPLGPLAMGGCRFLNVLLGMSVLRGSWQIEHWAAAAGIGVYIAGLTWFARDDARRSDRRQLAAATLVMLGGVGLIGVLPWLTDSLLLRLQRQLDLWQWYLFFALWAGYILLYCGTAIVQPSPGPVRAVVRRLITALIFLDAAACFAAAGRNDAILVAALIVPMTIAGWWVDRG
jgi:4-hydroxybenzoate polyprenyltransferase